MHGFRPTFRRLAVLSVLALCLGTGIVAQERQPVQQQDPEFARLVHEWTTRPEFISPLVDHLPEVPGIPSPKDVLGYDIGMPKKLTSYEHIVGYYRALAAKSPRVKVIDIGKTDEGREQVVVFVADAGTIKNLDQYRQYLAELADPRHLTAAEAHAVILKAKPLYHIMGGLHSAETGPPEMLMELAYRLATEDSPLIRQIRDNVIVSITPVAEPDGRDRYVDWYYRHLIDQTSDEDRLPGPPYWGKYVLHDNNRDINYSQVTMRNLLKWYLQWHPPIMHDLHESEPFMYTFSGQAPQNPSLDPILYGELPWFSNFEMAQMAKYGMPGVWDHNFVDMWSPGYLAFMSSNHNGMIRMYETFGNGGANTMLRHIARPGFGEGATKREWYRPWPPYKEVVWSMRDNTNYMETGILTALQLTSTFPKIILENFYKKTMDSIEDGMTKAPYAYVIPAGQRDMTRVSRVVSLLLLQGIEIGRATGPIAVKDATFPAGSFVVKLNQPYGRLAKTLLERQHYPDPSLNTYDDSAWTMGLESHTDVKAVDDKAILDAAVTPVTDARIPGSVAGAVNGAAAIAVAHDGSNNMITLRYALKDLKVEAADKDFKAEGIDFPAGSFIVATSQGANVASRVQEAVEQLGLTGAALAAAPSVPTHELNLPRLAVFSTWNSTQNVGWVRYALDQFKVPYDLIFKEQVRAGHLRDKYDVILIPDQGRTAKGLVFGIAPVGKPIDYEQTPQFKSLGMYGSSPDITGGMGLPGAEELHRFVDEGGLLITMGVASAMPPDFGITRDINAGHTSPRFYAPGPSVDAEILHPESPIFYGYTHKVLPVRWADGPLLRVPYTDEDTQVLMRFPGGEKSVLSGLMRGANELHNNPAIVETPVGKGQVLLYVTNPIYRWQNFGEYNMIFNALMNFDDLKVPSKPAAPTAAGH
ncbi:MAG: hypothetical protein KGN76_07300 [Acidobacteriota bacterium]|nr:hypothetical protein [Acidobacteriota bacterium]